MRMVLAVDVEVAIDGYEIRDLGPQRDIPGSTIANIPLVACGICLVQLSSRISKRRYTVGSGQPLWKKITKVKDYEGVAKFFNTYGALYEGSICAMTNIRFWFLDDLLDSFLAQKFIADRNSELIDELNKKTVERFNGFLVCGKMATAVDTYLDVEGAQAVCRFQFKSLLQFLLVEMISEIGVKRRSIESQRVCGNCGQIFTAGGGSPGARRSDALYCTPVCAKAASRPRAKKAITCTDG